MATFTWLLAELVCTVGTQWGSSSMDASPCPESDTGDATSEICEASEGSKASFVSFDEFVVDLEAGKVSYYFSWRDKALFKSVLWLEGVRESWEKIDCEGDGGVLHATLFHIGLCLVLWTWMGFGSPVIKIRAGHLNAEQRRYLEDLYAGVLGEYFLATKSPLTRVELQYECEEADGKPSGRGPSRVTAADEGGEPMAAGGEPMGDEINVLVPLGGGKDSIVVYELVKRAAEVARKEGRAPRLNCRWLYVGGEKGEFRHTWRFPLVVHVAGAVDGEGPTPNAETIDFDFFVEPSDADEYGKPVADFDEYARYDIECPPWAALVAFASLLVAHLKGFNYIAMGNERSANFGNGVLLNGTEVNHQHDKSFPFERRTHRYIRKYLCPPKRPVYYFSALMHWWEVQIMREFCAHPKYLPVFLSCNEAQLCGTSRWCAECAKCVFVYILLSAWLPPASVWSVFGDNLFETKALRPMIKALLGLTEQKPMECVGTPEEVVLSLQLALGRYETAGLPLPALFADPEVREVVETGAGLDHMLDDCNVENLLPDWFRGGGQASVCARMEETS